MIYKKMFFASALAAMILVSACGTKPAETSSHSDGVRETEAGDVGTEDSGLNGVTDHIEKAEPPVKRQVGTAEVTSGSDFVLINGTISEPVMIYEDDDCEVAFYGLANGEWRGFDGKTYWTGKHMFSVSNKKNENRYRVLISDVQVNGYYLLNDAGQTNAEMNWDPNDDAKNFCTNFRAADLVTPCGDDVSGISGTTFVLQKETVDGVSQMEDGYSREITVTYYPFGEAGYRECDISEYVADYASVLDESDSCRITYVSHSSLEPDEYDGGSQNVTLYFLIENTSDKPLWYTTVLQDTGLDYDNYGHDNHAIGIAPRGKYLDSYVVTNDEGAVLSDETDVKLDIAIYEHVYKGNMRDNLLISRHTDVSFRFSGEMIDVKTEAW